MNKKDSIIKDLSDMAIKLKNISGRSSENASVIINVNQYNEVDHFIKNLTADQLREAANHEYYTFKMPNGEDLTVAKSFAIDELEKRGLKP